MALKDDLQADILALPGVELLPSRFGGGEAFFLGRREVAHFHEGNELDLRLTRGVIREVKAELKEDGRVTRQGSSAWIQLRFRRRSDLPWLLGLVQRALDANDG